MATTPIKFLSEVKEELKKVVWPTRKVALRLTFSVIIISAVVGFFLGGVDFVLTKILETLLR